MKKIIIAMLVFSSCTYGNAGRVDKGHVESLAMDFMKNEVIPKMKEPRHYEVSGAKVIVRRASDKIDDYRFSYQHMSFNHEDSVLNKHLLDSVIMATANPDSILNITVNVAYKTKYQRGNIVTDSIKLGYDVKHDKISYWPF